MPLSAVTADNVRAALRAVRYGKPLLQNPLNGLAAVTLELRRQGMPDTRQTRQWALGALLADTVDERRRALRGQPEPAGRPEQKGAAAEIERDFRSGIPELEAWTALAVRYFIPTARPVGELAAELGIHERTLERRVTRGHELLAARLTDLEARAERDVLEHPGAPPQDRIQVVPTAPGSDPVESTRLLLEAVTSDRSVVRLNGHTAEAIAQRPATDLQSYRLGRIAEWSHARYRLDRRFVSLTMLVDRGELAGERWQADERFDDLGKALAAVPDRSLVLLGAPGSGKSTLLRRLEMDLSIEWLRNGADRVTFFVPLNRYRAESPGADPPPPDEWLTERWHARWPDLPPLPELVDSGRVVLLLDALNEMPHRGFEEYHALVMAWKDYLHAVLEDHPSNQVVFSCRSLDYSAPLSSSALRVPQVRIEPMSGAAVHRFLNLYSPSVGEGIWQVIDGTPQLDLVRVPYFCRLLVEQVESDDRIPAGRAALFTGFVRHALRREVERDNPLFVPGPLLTERDCRRILHPRAWRTDWDLPADGPLVCALQRLAFGMQRSSEGEEVAQVRVPVAEARALIVAPGRGGAGSGPGGASRAASGVKAEATAEPDAILRAGVSLAILDEDPAADETMFFHQLLQEYFAAREIAARPDPELARAAWSRSGVSPPLADVLAALEPSAPLPPLPATGWEETSVLAAGMSPDPDRFVLSLAEANLGVAGRAAAEPETLPRLSAPALDRLRSDLARRAEDAGADLRARLDAAWQLGRLGDPRLRGPDTCDDADPHLRGREANGGADLSLGPFVTVHEAGPPIAVARYPVTNAAWALFIAAGGYEDLSWWPAGPARDWQEGRGTARGSRDDYRVWRRRLLESPAMLEEQYRAGLVPEQIYEDWKRRMR